MLQLFAGIPLEIGAGAAGMLTSCNSMRSTNHFHCCFFFCVFFYGSLHPLSCFTAALHSFLVLVDVCKRKFNACDFKSYLIEHLELFICLFMYMCILFLFVFIYFIKGALCSLGEDIRFLCWNKSNEQTLWFHDWINKQFIFGGPCHLYSFKQF